MVLVVAGAVLLIVVATRTRRGGGAGWLLALGLPLVLLFAVVGTGGFMAEGGSDAPDAPPAVVIVEPLDSVEVASPVDVVLGVERLGSYHVHVTVDGPCGGEGDVIPTDADHHHLAAGEERLTLDLAPGQHTICAQAGDHQHRARPETQEVTILVAPA